MAQEPSAAQEPTRPRDADARQTQRFRPAEAAAPPAGDDDDDDDDLPPALEASRRMAASPVAQGEPVASGGKAADAGGADAETNDAAEEMMRKAPRSSVGTHTHTHISGADGPFGAPLVSSDTFVGWRCRWGISCSVVL